MTNHYRLQISSPANLLAASSINTGNAPLTLDGAVNGPFALTLNADNVSGRLNVGRLTLAINQGNDRYHMPSKNSGCSQISPQIFMCF